MVGTGLVWHGMAWHGMAWSICYAMLHVAVCLACKVCVCIFVRMYVNMCACRQSQYVV